MTQFCSFPARALTLMYHPCLSGGFSLCKFPLGFRTVMFKSWDWSSVFSVFPLQRWEPLYMLPEGLLAFTLHFELRIYHSNHCYHFPASSLFGSSHAFLCAYRYYFPRTLTATHVLSLYTTCSFPVTPQVKLVTVALLSYGRYVLPITTDSLWPGDQWPTPKCNQSVCFLGPFLAPNLLSWVPWKVNWSKDECSGNSLRSALRINTSGRGERTVGSNRMKKNGLWHCYIILLLVPER